MKDSDAFILTRDDLIAAFRIWNDDYPQDAETVGQVMLRMKAHGDDLATYQADQLIDCLIECALESPSE